MNQWVVIIVVIPAVVEHVQEDVWVVQAHALEDVKVFAEAIVLVVVLAVVLMDVLVRIVFNNY